MASRSHATIGSIVSISPYSLSMRSEIECFPAMYILLWSANIGFIDLHGFGEVIPPWPDHCTS